MSAVLHATQAAALSRLEQLGVAVEALQRAVAEGHAARISCTLNDAPFIPGTEAWRFTLRTLREELGPRGWRNADPGNFSLVINDKRRINVVVASGDAATRVAHLTPRTKAIKGLYTEAATIRNRILFPETLSEELRRVAASLEFPTWVLLAYITDEEFRAELSLPDIMEDGHIVSWAERIFVPDPDEPFGIRSKDASPDTGPEIDVPVRRKA
jgi:hypothetical protein